MTVGSFRDGVMNINSDPFLMVATNCATGDCDERSIEP